VESDSTFNGIIEHEYDVPQICLRELLLDIPVNDIDELWEISYIATTSTSPATPHYVVILKDSTSICTCMSIVNKGMPCRHQYHVLLQSSRAVFHITFINNRWFEMIPSDTNIMICQGMKTSANVSLHYIEQIRPNNVYIPAIREKVNKKIQFGTAMSLAKTSIQIAVSEGVVTCNRVYWNAYAIQYEIS
jgi:hypothetical protein